MEEPPPATSEPEMLAANGLGDSVHTSESRLWTGPQHGHLRVAPGVGQLSARARGASQGTEHLPRPGLVLASAHAASGCPCPRPKGAPRTGFTGCLRVPHTFCLSASLTTPPGLRAVSSNFDLPWCPRPRFRPVFTNRSSTSPAPAKTPTRGTHPFRNTSS